MMLLTSAKREEDVATNTVVYVDPTHKPKVTEISEFLNCHEFFWKSEMPRVAEGRLTHVS
jgi:hypothetical protein